MKILLFAFSLGLSVCVSFTQSQLLRGPYLQLGTPVSMHVRWATDVATPGKIKYGLHPTALTDSIVHSVPMEEHEFVIPGLQPSTRYYYTLYPDGVTPLAPGDSNYYFQTSPLPGTEPPIDIWVIGDMGKNNQGQIDTKEAFKQYRGNRHTDVWLWLGDNAYESGTLSQYQEKVFDIYPEIFRNTVAWPSPGNHDYGSINQLTNQGPYFDLFSMPENGEAGGLPSGTEGYYSFDYGNVHFVSLNSDRYIWVLNPLSPMHQWLRDDLAATDKKWKVVYWHQPPYTKGSHDSDIEPFFMSQMRNSIVPICEAYGVDLVLCGHSHVYERSYLIKGHFGASWTFDPQEHIIDGSSGRFDAGTPYIKKTTGDSANFGTVYCVVGNSGSYEGESALNHPAHFFGYQISHGSMSIHVEGNRMDVQYVNTLNEVLDDFTLIKDSLIQPPTLSTGPVDPSASVWLFPNPATDQVTIQLLLETGGEIVMEVRDMNGQNALSVFKGEVIAGEFSYTLPLQGLTAGNYVLRVHTPDGIFQRPLIKL